MDRSGSLTVAGQAVSVSQAAPAPDRARALPIAPALQQTVEWCWAAVAEMVLRYLGEPNLNAAGDYQCGIVGVAGAIGVFPPTCNASCYSCVQGMSTAAGYNAVLASYPDIARRLGLPGKTLTPTFVNRALTFAEIQAEVDGGHPVLTLATPTGVPSNVGPSHATLTIGYRVIGNTQVLVVNDPFPYGLGPWGPLGDPYLRAGCQLVGVGQDLIPYSAFTNQLAYAYTHVVR